MRLFVSKSIRNIIFRVNIIDWFFFTRQLVMQLFFLNFSCFDYLFSNKNNPIVIFIFYILLTLLFSPEGHETWPNPKRSVAWPITDSILSVFFYWNALVTDITMSNKGVLAKPRIFWDLAKSRVPREKKQSGQNVKNEDYNGVIFVEIKNRKSWNWEK